MQAMKLLCVVVSLMVVSVGANKLCHLMDKMRDVFNIVERIEDKLDDCGCGNGNGNGTLTSQLYIYTIFSNEPRLEKTCFLQMLNKEHDQKQDQLRGKRLYNPSAS